MRLMASALIALMLFASLNACGKKGSPERPPGSDFPRMYPNPSPSQ